MADKTEYYNIGSTIMDPLLEGIERLNIHSRDGIPIRADLWYGSPINVKKVKEQSKIRRIRGLVKNIAPWMVRTQQSPKEITVGGLKPYLYATEKFYDFDQKVWLATLRDICPSDLVKSGVVSWEAGDRCDSYKSHSGYTLSLERKTAEGTLNSHKIEYDNSYYQELVAFMGPQSVFVTNSTREAINANGGWAMVTFMKGNWRIPEKLFLDGRDEDD